MAEVNTMDLFNAIQEEFEKLISVKNSWGKNELLLIIEKAKVNAIVRLVS